MNKNFKNKLLRLAIFISAVLLFSCNNKSNNSSSKDVKWPPALPTANKNGVAMLSPADLLQVPVSVQNVLDSNSEVQLTIAKEAPKIEFVYFNQLPNAALNGHGWSSWGDICIASDGKVYCGIGNHGGIKDGEAYVYCWDPSTKELKKIADLNKITKAKPQEVHFSKVHAHIIEGKDKKIYFTGTLDDGALAGSTKMLSNWTGNISGGKIFQYDPTSGKTIVIADFPKARVTANLKYDKERNILYCALQGDPAYNNGITLGAFDMNKREWIYEGIPGEVSGLDRNFMIDSRGNVYFNGLESSAHSELRLKTLLADLKKDQDSKANEGGLSLSKIQGIQKWMKKEDIEYTTLWKYDPVTNSIAPTNSYFKGEGFRSETRESKSGYIYGTTMGGELFRYAPAKDELTILGSNFLVKGGYVPVCVLSPDEKYLYYLPSTRGPASLSGSPVIQYDIENGQEKALAFLYDPMKKAFNYEPGGTTYGLKISDDGSTLYASLNGAPIDSLKPKGMEHGTGYGLTSFAIIHIPSSERSGN